MAQIKAGRKIAAIIVPVVALLLLLAVWIPCGLFLGTGSVAWASLAEVKDDPSLKIITAYVDESLSDAEAKSVGVRINSIDNVHRIQFISREEALENFVADHPGFEDVQPEDLRHRYEVEVEDPDKLEQTAAEIEAIPGVAKVSYSKDLRNTVQSANDGAMIVVIVSASLGALATLLILVVAVVAEVLILRRPKQKRQDV